MHTARPYTILIPKHLGSAPPLTYSMAKVLRQLITMECLQIITIQVLSVFCCFLLGSLWLNQIKPFRILKADIRIYFISSNVSRCRGKLTLRSHVDAVGRQRHAGLQPPKKVILTFLGRPSGGIDGDPIAHWRKAFNYFTSMESTTVLKW